MSVHMTAVVVLLLLALALLGFALHALDTQRPR